MPQIGADHARFIGCKFYILPDQLAIAKIWSMGIPFSKYDPKDFSPAQLQEWVNGELGDWGKNVRIALMESIRKQNLQLSGELINSLEFQVQAAAENKLAHVFFSFQDYGRHKDMRSLVYTKQAPVEAMEEFVRKVGLSNFKYVPGYTAGRMPSEDIAIKRIAWGISKGRLNAYKHKPQKWFAKRFYGQINLLITRMLEGYQDGIVNQAKKEMAA